MTDLACYSVILLAIVAVFALEPWPLPSLNYYKAPPLQIVIVGSFKMCLSRVFVG
jgi:hypothetical protein